MIESSKTSDVVSENILKLRIVQWYLASGLLNQNHQSKNADLLRSYSPSEVREEDSAPLNRQGFPFSQGSKISSGHRPPEPSHRRRRARSLLILQRYCFVAPASVASSFARGVASSLHRCICGLCTSSSSICVGTPSNLSRSSPPHTSSLPHPSNKQ